MSNVNVSTLSTNIGLDKSSYPRNHVYFLPHKCVFDLVYVNNFIDILHREMFNIRIRIGVSPQRNC